MQNIPQKKRQLTGSQRLKVLSVFGTRPEASKMAPLVNELKADSRFESYVCVSAQHREMLDQVLEIFNIVPDFDLNIMQQKQSLSGVTSKAFLGVESVFESLTPDVVLVHGDTTTSFAAALAAFYSRIPVGHVEAGLRTYNKYEPFPEEINRCLTGVLADIHFSPTLLAKQNLLNENVSEQTIYVTGNTAIDAISSTVDENHIFHEDILNSIDFKAKKVISMTAHRRENLGAPLESICRAVKRIAQENAEVEIVYAVHLNPAVRDTVYPILSGIKNVHLVKPLDLKDMHNLMYRSCFVLTDSGGLQEEAPGFKKPVVVLRNVTERPEGIEAGTLVLAGTGEESIYNICQELLPMGDKYKKMAAAKNPFGDGHTSRRIADALLYEFGIMDMRPEDYLV